LEIVSVGGIPEVFCLLQIDSEPVPDDCEHGDNGLTFTVLLFPGIDVMETIMSRNVKPLDVVGMIVVSWHDSISAWFLLVEVENKLLLLDGILWVSFEWKIREDNVIFSNLEVMNHSGGCYWNSNLRS